MIETLKMFAAGMGGAALGALFFGGLWWTVRRGVLSSSPALWFLGSLLLRVSVVLGGFYFVGHGDWRRLVACLAGFVLARLVVMHLTRPSPTPSLEVSHASQSR